MWIATGRGKSSGLLEEDRWPFILVDRLAHIEGITLGTSEEVDKVAGGPSGMGVDGIGEVVDRTSEGQSAEVYGADFTAGSLAGKGARCGTRGTGNKASIDKELMPPNTDQITCRHLELAYQFVLSSRLTVINLR